MFGFFKKAKSAKELDRIIAEITMNMQNNYKDAAQSAFKELEQRFDEMAQAGIAENKITLEKGEYFVLGDNRNNSRDSRDPSVGTIPKDQIIGKAFIRIWPFEKFGILRHQ